MDFETQVDALFSYADDETAELAGLHDFDEATPYTSGCGARYPENVLVKEEVRTYLRDVSYPITPEKRLPSTRLVRHVDGVEEHVWTFVPVNV
jgi:Phenol hydroxylase, C-terminal dimerisation domain